MRAPSARSAAVRSASVLPVRGLPTAAPAGGHPSPATGSLAAVADAVGARLTWRRVDASGRAVTGAGVGVAVLDSGVNPVRGLDAPGKLVAGPDTTPESSDAATAGRDTAGHGTHLAGIVAACDPGPRDARTGAPLGLDRPGPSWQGPSGQLQYGIAPDARLFAPKLATATGATDVGSVVETLHWLSEHASDPGVGVRVVLLALGTEVLGGGRMDALTAAARRAWRSGLTVVVSAGNDGNDAPLTNPAIDPFVLAVGSSAPTGGSWTSPVVSPFSNGGTAERHVDVLAPGVSVESLRNPGSTADRDHPEGLVPGDTTGRLFRGTGTSQAAAVVAGAAALLLQANPDLTPDQVKAALMLTARPLAGVGSRLQGAGQVDVDAAVALAASLPPAAEPGRHNIVEDDLAAGATVSRSSMKWSSMKWSAAAWSSMKWSSMKWSSMKWSAAAWSSMKWSSMKWSAVAWTSMKWSSMEWSAVAWTSMKWS